jgi:hypothetical protein
MGVGHRLGRAIAAGTATAVAATAGVALAGASGQAQLWGSGGPTAYSASRPLGPKNVTKSGFALVRRLNLPSATYLVTAKVTLATNAPGTTGADCVIRSAGKELDSASHDLTTNGLSSRSTINLQYTGKAGSSIDLSCRAGAAWFANTAKISAVRVELGRLPAGAHRQRP